ncbi:hypothetical protein NE237_033281 [Protea cynaroides]|uniref:Uncharacterized protein n=1 Tax=Protea cynaroides TaxID=273540 RepID=A0A9Q0L516_9MAGN|nr:hypothetical protein NE237_033281 [Protea cynaroides]
MEDHHLLQPIVSTITTTTTAIDDDDIAVSTSAIIYRMVMVIFIAIVSIWANYEASKGFEIIIINDAGNTPAGHRFAVFFISDGKAIRIVQNTSEFAEKVLYPNASQPKKQVHHVTLRLAGRNLTDVVVVNMSKSHEFVLHISPSMMEEINLEKAMVSAVQRGMARVWLWDGEISTAPRSIIDGMVEYVGISAGFGGSPDSGGLKLPEFDGNSCWDDRDSVNVARFLNYCERVRPGFIGRLNQAMRDGWDVRTVDDALGLPAQQLCYYYYSSIVRISNVMGPTSTSGRIQSI